jgi:predicted alternative tryptophan synthase beta-subunit
MTAYKIGIVGAAGTGSNYSLIFYRMVEDTYDESKDTAL